MTSTRRRGAELEAAIRSAVLELLAAHGPAGVTMESVAAAARTSKPVLYRRWPDRAGLLRDTLLSIATTTTPHVDTGSYRTDMLAALRGWADLFASPRGPLLGAAVVAGANDPEFADAFRRDVLGWRKQEMEGVLQRGIERGDVRPDVPVEIARELGTSVLWQRLLITGDPITDELIVTLVDDVLLPFVAPRHSVACTVDPPGRVDPKS